MAAEEAAEEEKEAGEEEEEETTAMVIPLEPPLMPCKQRMPRRKGGRETRRIEQRRGKLLGHNKLLPRTNTVS